MTPAPARSTSASARSATTSSDRSRPDGPTLPRESSESLPDSAPVAARTAGIATTIRFNRGTEIGAACGQLAAEHAGQPAPIVVQRRRERLVDESARALRGERSDEPVPAGVGEGRG